MSIRVIILDVDGTLYSSDKKIMPQTKQALLDAQAMGIKVVVASGRPTSGLTKIAKALELDKHHGLLVSYNGSKITDCESGDVLFNQPLSVAEGKAVLRHVKNFDVIPMIDKGAYMNVENVYHNEIMLHGKPKNIIEMETREGQFLLCEQPDLEAFLDYEVNKILTAATPEYLDSIVNDLQAPFKDSLNCVKTSAFFFEFTAKGIDKANALAHVLEPMGYSPSEMIAFGDGMNDHTMLAYVGTGVAMGNAVPQVKAIADHVTASHDEEGIAQALYQYIPELKK